MLEGYYVKPSTIERVRASWLAPQIETYFEWLEAHAYPRLAVFRPGAAVFFNLPSSHRRRVAEMLLPARSISMSSSRRGWTTEARQRLCSHWEKAKMRWRFRVVRYGYYVWEFYRPARASTAAALVDNSNRWEVHFAIPKRSFAHSVCSGRILRLHRRHYRRRRRQGWRENNLNQWRGGAPDIVGVANISSRNAIRPGG